MFTLPQVPERGDVMLVTDELSAPADFVLHGSLATHLKDPAKSGRCTVLSVSESIARWKAIATKSNLNISQATSSGSLVFVEPETSLGNSLSLNPPTLRPLYDQLSQHLQKETLPSRHTLLIIDDASTLEWIGFSTLEVSRFLRAICASCRKMDASLIIRHHVLTPDEPDDLLRLLLQICTYRVDVFPLSSGRSGSVSGQVALHPGASHVKLPFSVVPRGKAVLYRLADASCTLFERGTGAAVL